MAAQPQRLLAVVFSSGAHAAGSPDLGKLQGLGIGNSGYGNIGVGNTFDGNSGALNTAFWNSGHFNTGFGSTTNVSGTTNSGFTNTGSFVSGFNNTLTGSGNAYASGFFNSASGGSILNGYVSGLFSLTELLKNL
jgi:hypothetical protein